MSHFRSESICSATFAFAGLLAGLVVRLDERRDQHVERRQVAVERGVDERAEREILLVLQHADGVDAARVLTAALHVRRIILASSGYCGPAAEYGQLFVL